MHNLNLTLSEAQEDYQDVIADTLAALSTEINARHKSLAFNGIAIML